MNKIYKIKSKYNWWEDSYNYPKEDDREHIWKTDGLQNKEKWMTWKQLQEDTEKYFTKHPNQI